MERWHDALESAKLMESLASHDPESETFLGTEKVGPLLDLTGTKSVDAVFLVARQFLHTKLEGSTCAEDDNWTVETLFATFHKTLEAMPSVIVSFKSALTFSTATKMSFCMCMRHPRKANLIQLSFEKELTKKGSS
jgi:hypothetical protein